MSSLGLGHRLHCLLPTLLRALCTSFYHQLSLRLWTRGREVMSSLHHLPISQPFASLEVSLFGNPFIASSPCFFSSLHNLFTPGEFCLCLWASLFLFHSQNPFWDSILVHPSLQLTSVQAGRVISPSGWRWQLWFCPASSDVFCFPRWSRKAAYLELAWCCLCCCQGALLPKPRLEKMGHLAKMSLYYLSISFSKSRVLVYVWCVLSLVRL